MVQLLAALVGVGIILTIFTGYIGLALTIPAAIALLLLLRSRQSATKVDPRHLGGPQPETTGGRSDNSSANPH